MTQIKTRSDVLAEAVALVNERSADVAARCLAEWDGSRCLVVVEQPEPGSELSDRELDALSYIRRYGRKVGVTVAHREEQS